MNLTERICNSLDNGQFSCGVSIDLQKAFDTVDYEISLRKLELYGSGEHATIGSASI